MLLLICIFTANFVVLYSLSLFLPTQKQRAVSQLCKYNLRRQHSGKASVLISPTKSATFSFCLLYTELTLKRCPNLWS